MRQRLVVLSALVLLLSTVEAANQDWFEPKVPTKGLAFKPYSPRSGRFAMEYPSSKWKVFVPGRGMSVTFVQKDDEASVTIEREVLPHPMNLDLINETATQIEQERVNENNPGASNVTSALGTIGGMKAIVVDYTFQGDRGLERTRHVALLLGKEVYRFVCTSLQSKFAKDYEPIFRRMVESFKPSPVSTAQ